MNAGRQANLDREASLRRIAIVLNSLPAPVAGRLLANVDDQRRSDLRRTMTSLSDVDPLERKRALESFSGNVIQRVQGSDAADPSHDATSQHAEQNTDPAHQNRGSSAGGTPFDDRHPLGFLATVPEVEVVKILRGEHPQTAALVLASIPPEKAAKLLAGFDSRRRQDVIRRIGHLQDMAPDALGEVAEMLKAKCLQIEVPTKPSSGSDAMRAILARMTIPSSGVSMSQPMSGAVSSEQQASWTTPSREDSFSVATANTMDDEFMPSDRAGASRRIDPSALMDQDRRASHVDPAMVKQSDATLGGATPGKNQTAERQRQTSGTGTLESDGNGPRILPFDTTATAGWSTEQINRQLDSMSPAGLCEALGRVETRDALLTLCGISVERADKAIARLPKAQQRSTRKALANLGPLQLSEIDRAKERVFQATQKAVAA
ncbi:MAG: hypothetical protein AAF989_11055 [Planctomycetota bacterium]